LAAAQVTRSRDWYGRAPRFEEQWEFVEGEVVIVRRLPDVRRSVSP
jgi:hypothetical protein